MPFTGFPPTYTVPSAGTTAFAGKTIASADWNSLFTDLGTAINALGKGTQGVSARLLIRNSVNFNVGNTDTSFSIVIPSGITRYVMSNVIISGASGTLTTATAGLFTAAGGAGVAIVTAASAITVNTAAENTNNNLQQMAINNGATESYTATQLFFRVANPQGVAATGIVTIVINPL